MSVINILLFFLCFGNMCYSQVLPNYLLSSADHYKTFFINSRFIRSDLSSFSSSAKSKGSDNQNYLPKWYNMFTNIPEDCLRFIDKETTVKNLPKYLGIASLTAGLIITDNKTYQMSHRFYGSSSFGKDFDNFFTAMGDGKTQIGLAAIFGAYGLIAKDDRALRTGSQIVEVVLASGAVVQVIKHITGRQIPITATKPGGVWRFFPNQIEYFKHTSSYDAYPSGHLTTSLATFLVIANNYFEIKWIRPVSYILSGLIAFGLVSKGIHWYSDFPLAIDLADSFANIVTNPLNNKINSAPKKISYNFSPFYNGISMGLSFSCNF